MKTTKRAFFVGQDADKVLYTRQTFGEIEVLNGGWMMIHLKGNEYEVQVTGDKLTLIRYDVDLPTKCQEYNKAIDWFKENFHNLQPTPIATIEREDAAIKAKWEKYTIPQHKTDDEIPF